MRDYVFFYLNGKPCEIRGEKAAQMLSDFLRYEAGLPGTKVVCAEGDCGACSVLRRSPWSGDRAFEPINSCITTLAQMDGSSLVTVEALASAEDLTPVQSAMVQCHGSQCGFCTPGFVMALTGLVEKKLTEQKKGITEREAKNALTGNLCRCTGYQPILDAATSLTVGRCAPLTEKFFTVAIQKRLRAETKQAVKIEAEGFTFFAPTRALEVGRYLAKAKGARILGAGTDLGVLVNKLKLEYKSVVSLHLIPELYQIKKKEKRLRIGGRATLAEVRNATEKDIPEFATFLDLFASPQIKNVATLVGNLVNASPIADTPPFLLVAGTTVRILGPKGKREVPIEKFFLGYRKTALKPGEWVSEIEIDIPAVNERLRLRKISQRKDLDISCVNLAMRYSPDRNEIRLAFGGVAATPVRLPKTEKFLKGKTLSRELFPAVMGLMQSEISPQSDLRGSAAFRRVLAENLLEDCLSEVTP